MNLSFLKSERFWKWVLWVGVGIFLTTRLLTLMSFPVFNDEGIYLQYSQAIHEDFSKYKFVSEGGIFSDWKPPLQYWIGSVFFVSPHVSNYNPLFYGRLSVFFVSILGLLGLYLFVRELLGKREAALVVMLYAICPATLFYNNQFIAEVFVFSIAPWLYWSILKATRVDKIRPWYLLAAAIFGAMLLLSKQSGAEYLYLAVLMPITVSAHYIKNFEGGSRDWGGMWLRIGLVFGVVISALMLRRLGVSAETAPLEKQFNGNWVMTAQELFAYPIEVWRSNFIEIRDYYISYYSVFVVAPILYFFFLAATRKNFKLISLGLGFLGGSFAVLFLLKGFNEYIYNTAVIVFLLPMLVCVLLSVLDRFSEDDHKLHRIARYVVAMSFLLMAGHWIYQDALMKISPAGYIRRSTPWAVRNYLENWSGGFGVMEAMAYIKEKVGPGIVLADPQWGNPRTTMEVYNPTYPRMRVVGITGDFSTAEGTKAARAYISGQPFKVRLAVFSSARNDARAVWQDNIEKYLCDERREVKVEMTQPPIVICSF